MVLKNEKNTPVVLEVTDLATKLIAFRQFKGLNFLTTGDLVDFLSVPSLERAEFLAMFDTDVIVSKSVYCAKRY